jgi:hypothetical protein
VRTLVGHPLESLTSQSVTDIDRLLAELRKVRRQGYATNLGEMDDGVHAVAVPVATTTETCSLLSHLPRLSSGCRAYGFPWSCPRCRRLQGSFTSTANSAAAAGEMSGRRVD